MSDAARACILRIAANTAASTGIVDSTRPKVPFSSVDEKRARFLEYLVEFLGGHFSN